MVCLDSDVMIDYLHGKEQAVRFVNGLLATGSRISTTVMSVCELYRGSDQNLPKGRQEVDRFLGFLEIYDLDLRACTLYRELYQKLSQKGQLVGDFDLLIACIAMANGDSIATGNQKHFSKVPGLRLEKFQLGR